MLISVSLSKKRASICFISVLITVCSLVFLDHSQLPVISRSVSLPIIMYHSVCNDNKLACDYIISTDTFREDIEYLHKHGYNSISVSELINWSYGNDDLPENPIMITLDDGFLNNLTEVLPILREFDFKAVVSVVGSYSDSFTQNCDRNPLYAYLTYSDIIQLHDSGYIEIGNHTYNMHSLGIRRGCMKKWNESDSEYRASLETDIHTFENALMSHTGIRPIAFTYPYGLISDASFSVLKKFGYKVAFTCNEKINVLTGSVDELLHLGRFNRPGTTETSVFMANTLCSLSTP